MIIEIAIVILIAMKLGGVVEISWTLTILFSTVLILIEIQTIIEKNKMLKVIQKVADATDKKFFQHDAALSLKADRGENDSERDW